MDKKSKVEVDHSEDAFFADGITVTYGPNKFVLDFKQTTPRVDFVHGDNQRTMVTKHDTLLVDVKFAKMLKKMLENSINKYEEKFGEIKIDKNPKKKEDKDSVSTEDTGYIG